MNAPTLVRTPTPMHILALTPALFVAWLPAPDPASPVAWPAGPLDVRVAFDRPVDPSLARALVGRSIPYGEPKSKEPLGRLRIAAARLDDGGRTLVLATDPHPREAVYTLNLLAAGGRPARSVSYTLN